RAVTLPRRTRKRDLRRFSEPANAKPGAAQILKGISLVTFFVPAKKVTRWPKDSGSSGSWLIPIPNAASVRSGVLVPELAREPLREQALVVAQRIGAVGGDRALQVGAVHQFLVALADRAVVAGQQLVMQADARRV